MQKKKPVKLIKRPYLKEELLGQGTTTFQLNQSEYVAKRMIDVILYKVFNTVRKINITRMEPEYSSYKMFNDLTKLINFSLIKSDEDKGSVKYDFNFDIEPPKIDTWVSNHTNTILRKNLTEKDANEDENKKQEEKDKKLDMFSKLKSLNKSSIIKDNSKEEKDNKKKKYEITASKKPQAREHPMENMRKLVEENTEVVDEIEEMKLNGYRTYFQEKEIERQKRKKAEKLQEERKREEEKTIKSLMEVMKTSKLLSFDMNGCFQEIKYIKDNEFKGFFEGKCRIFNKKKIADYEGIFANQSKLPPEVEKLPEEPQPTFERFYQADPAKTVKLSKGVSLTSYGLKKEGGNYISETGKMTWTEYKHILSEISPFEKATIVKKHVKKKTTTSEITEKEEEEKEEEKEKEEVTKNPEKKKKVVSKVKTQKIFHLFRDDMVGENKLDDEEKKKSKQKNIVKTKNMVQRQPIIKKKKQGDQFIHLTNKEVNIDDIQEINVEQMKNMFEMEERDFIPGYEQKKTVMPTILHTQKEKLKVQRQRKGKTKLPDDVKTKMEQLRENEYKMIPKNYFAKKITESEMVMGKFQEEEGDDVIKNIMSELKEPKEQMLNDILNSDNSQKKGNENQ